MFRLAAVPSVVLVALLACGGVAAQGTGKASHNKYGSPLDTLMSTRLWTDTGPAQDFVRDSRPDPKALDYAPLTGSDPERPKPRDKANVEALQAELERDRDTNEKKGRAVRGPLQPARRPRPR